MRCAGDAGGVHEASHGDERLHVSRASAVHTAACAKVIHKRLHCPAQALRAEDPTETRSDALLTLKPPEQPQGVGPIPRRGDGFHAPAVAVVVYRLEAPLGEGIELALECGWHVE